MTLMGRRRGRWFLLRDLISLDAVDHIPSQALRPVSQRTLLFRSLRVLGGLGHTDVVVNTAYQADEDEFVLKRRPTS